MKQARVAAVPVVRQPARTTRCWFELLLPYPFWSGALFNRGRNKADKVDIDLSHSNLAPGLLCADGQYRQIVTVEDAVRGGCNLFDLDQLRMEYSPDEYQNLLMCEFVDDLASVFPLSELQACMVDSWEVWTDFLCTHTTTPPTTPLPALTQRHGRNIKSYAETTA